MLYSTKQNAALLFLRIIIAVIFLVAAYYKISFWSVTPEGMSAGMAFIMKLLSIAEPLGALALVIGFKTRLAAAGLFIILLGAIYELKFSMGMGFVTPTGAGWNFPLVCLSGCAILMAFGAGDWSVERNKK